MLEGAALIYGLLAAFVVASVQRNHKSNRAHAPALVYAGWLLLGVSIGGAGLLGAVAVQHAAIVTGTATAEA